MRVAGAVIAVGAVALAGGYFVLANQSVGGPGAAVADLSGEIAEAPTNIDPACLWPVLDGALSPDAPPAPDRLSLVNCLPEGAQTEIDGDWNRVSLQKGEPGDVDFERRFSGFRVAHFTADRQLVLQAYDNWGGSGTFSSLITAHLGTQGQEITDITVHAFGDRCNGGLAGVSAGQDGRVVAQANMTPWDIMMFPLAELPFEAQWDAAKERYGDAVGKAAGCAVCCSAVVHEYEVVADGALLPRGLRFEPSASPSSEDALTGCLVRAVQQSAGKDGLVDTQEQLFLTDLIDGCAQAALK